MTHPNSREAISMISRDGRRGTRVDEIKSALQFLGVATDRQIAAHLGKSDPNYVRPRITENIHGIFEECGTKLDADTGCHVRLVRLRPRPGTQRSLWT